MKKNNLIYFALFILFTVFIPTVLFNTSLIASLYLIVIISIFFALFNKKYQTINDDVSHFERFRDSIFTAGKMVIESDSDEVYRVVLDNAIKVVKGGKSGLIQLLDFPGDRLFEIACIGDSTKFDPFKGSSFKTSVFYPYYINKHKEPFIIESYRNTLHTPIYRDEWLIGVMSIAKADHSPFTPSDIKFLTYFSKLISIALKYKELMDTSKRLANRDVLTGIYNRKFFEESFTHYQAKAYSEHLTFSIVLIDMNYLKSINDHFGHIYGDEALKTLANWFLPYLNGFDIFARYGGDEFILIFENCNATEAEKKMKAIWTDFKGVTIDYHGTSIPIQFSYGISECPDDSMILDILVKLADNKMYAHKKALKESNLSDPLFEVLI